MESHQPLMNPSSEFNDFLFAVICEERDGAQLSVLSALARTDVDPWEEASRLSRMSVAIAESSVMSLIDRTAVHSTSYQKASIAARLVKLLPRPRTVTRSTPAAAASLLAKSPDLSTQVLVFMVGWWIFVMVVSALGPHKTTAGADLSAPYSSAHVLPRDARPESGSAAIKDGFPFADVRISR